MIKRTEPEKAVSNAELEKLVTIYKQLPEPQRSIFVMSGNLLLASQMAEKHENERPVA